MRIEFNDPDDPIHNDGGIRIKFTPEAMVLALPNAKTLGLEDQVAMGQLLRLAYAQGKRIGTHKTIEDAKIIYRTQHLGGCKIPSRGDGCDCVLCQLDDLRPTE